MKQPILKHLSEEEKQKLKTMMDNFSTAVSETSDKFGKLGCVRERNKLGESNTFHPHQVIACQRIFEKAGRTSWDVLNVTMFIIHRMGLGKTVTAGAGFLGGLYKFKPPSRDFRNLIIAEKQVIRTWAETIDNWLVFGTETEVVVVENSKDATLEKLKNAKIVITTADTLVAAVKTFSWWNPRDRFIGMHGNEERWAGAYTFGHSPADIERGKFAPDHVPDIHPFWSEDIKWSSLIVDEADKIINPRTWWFKAVSDMAKKSVYKLVLAGLLGRNRPGEAAALCKCVNVSTSQLHEKKAWTVKGEAAEKTINRTTVAFFHREFVDRVDEADAQLPEMQRTIIRFKPQVGRLPDGTYDQAVLDMHNNKIRMAHSVVHKMRSRGMQQFVSTREMGKLMKAVTGTEQICLDNHLGLNGADAYNATRNAQESAKRSKMLYESSLGCPSTTVQILYRAIRSRQKSGHPKIVAFCTQTTMLKIARNYCESRRDCGTMFMFTGEVTTATARQTMIKAFNEMETRGVFWMSGTGVRGINLPGTAQFPVDTMILFGSMPWTRTDIEQAEARIVRITQRNKCQALWLVPFGSPGEGKEKIYQDKGDRLQAALTDADFSNFKNDEEDSEEARGGWKFYGSIAAGMGLVNRRGNYIKGDQAEYEFEKYHASMQLYKERTALDPGTQPPDMPASVRYNTVMNPEEVEIPDDPFPTPGFVEAELPRKHKKARISLPDIEAYDSDQVLNTSDDDSSSCESSPKRKRKTERSVSTNGADSSSHANA